MTSLAQRTLELVNIASPSHEEAPLYDYISAAVPLPVAFDDGESVLYAKRSGKPLVLLAGHTDTVPAQDNLPGRIEGGAVHGLGATDMKGGLAVMLALARLAHGRGVGAKPAVALWGVVRRFTTGAVRPRANGVSSTSRLPAREIIPRG